MTSLKLLVVLFFLHINWYSIGDSAELENTDLVIVESEEEAESPLIVHSHVSKDEATSYNVFTPTDEWQEIPEGMAIPQGAHIRMNMETGKNEVKLMDNSENQIDPSKHGPKFSVMSDEQQDTLVSSRHKVFSQEELADALSGIKPEEIVTDEDRERVSKEYRSVDELREDFEKINAAITTDFKILQGHVTELKVSIDTIDKDRLLFIYDEIELLSHQFDNGIELTKMGAIPIFLHHANSTDDDVIQAALLALGSTMQSNQFVQENALQSGILPVIYKAITSPDAQTRSRAIFALSTLLRHFPPAQELFLKSGGVPILKRLFTSCADKVSVNEKLAVKIVGLVGDLVAENDQAVLNEYSELSLRATVAEADWCNAATGLLSSQRHDTREKALRLMNLLEKECRSSFVPFKQSLVKLKNEYSKLMSEETTVATETKEILRQPVDTGEDDYYQRMSESISKLISNIPDASSSHVDL